MQVTVYEVVFDHKGSHYEVAEVERNYPGEGQNRYSSLCEICGFSRYPEWVKYCQNGNGERD